MINRRIVDVSVDDTGATLEVDLEAATCERAGHLIASGDGLPAVRFELDADRCAAGWVESSPVHRRQVLAPATAAEASARAPRGSRSG